MPENFDRCWILRMKKHMSWNKPGLGHPEAPDSIRPNRDSGTNKKMYMIRHDPSWNPCMSLNDFTLEKQVLNGWKCFK